MKGNDQPIRKHPAHPSPIIKANRPAIIFLTVCVEDRRPLLANETAHRLLLDAWTKADRWMVGRYIVMPDHVHLFCAPVNLECRLRNWIDFWRNQVTREWPNESEKPIWQRDSWDTQLRRGESYSEKWDYVRRNPVRARLASSPDEWPYAGEMNVLRW